MCSMCLAVLNIYNIWVCCLQWNCRGWILFTVPMVGKVILTNMTLFLSSALNTFCRAPSTGTGVLPITIPAGSGQAANFAAGSFSSSTCDMNPLLALFVSGCFGNQWWEHCTDKCHAEERTEIKLHLHNNGVVIWLNELILKFHLRL